MSKTLTKRTDYLVAGAQTGSKLDRARDNGTEILSEDDFFQKGIDLEYQEYDHPEYSQRYPGFVPNLSLIDLLFNVGDKSRDVLMHSITI